MPGFDRLAGILMAVFLAIATFQLLPLPIGLVRVLSPARVELLNAVQQVSGATAHYVTLSAAPFKTLIYVLTLAGYLATVLLVRDIAFTTRSTPWAAVWPLLIVGALEAVLGFYQAYVEGGEGFAAGTYVNRDHFAGLLEMILPFAVMYPVAILHRGSKRHESPAVPALQACGVLTIAAVLLIAIVHSLSRMGFITALTTLFIAASIALGLRSWRTDASQAPVTLWRRWFPMGLVAAVVVLGFIFLPTDPLIARFADFAKTEDITADTRSQLWADTTGLIKSYPLFGCGLGSYESCFYKLKTDQNGAHDDDHQAHEDMPAFSFQYLDHMDFLDNWPGISRATFAMRHVSVVFDSVRRDPKCYANY